MEYRSIACLASKFGTRQTWFLIFSKSPSLCDYLFFILLFFFLFCIRFRQLTSFESTGRHILQQNTMLLLRRATTSPWGTNWYARKSCTTSDFYSDWSGFTLMSIYFYFQVFFYIDPEFETDPKMDGVKNLILSYTFFKVPDDK